MPSPDQIQHFFDFAAGQLRGLIETHPDRFPIYTCQGKWDFSGESWTNWCEGFLGGQLWLLYLHTGDDYWRERAEHYSRLIAPRRTDRSVHDLGFLFWPTWKRWYDLARDPEINALVIEAGQTLALRFNEKGRYLRSFLAEDSLFMDIMMNVGIIFYAANQTGDPNLLRIATQHCLTTRRCLVRGDGSTAHEGFSTCRTARSWARSTQQGYRADSCWARGLAWALYGFGTVYGFTRDPRFLQTAEAVRAVLYGEHPRSRRAAQRLGRTLARPALRKLRRRHRRRGLYQPRPPHRGRGQAAAYTRVRPAHPRHPADPRVPGRPDPGLGGPAQTRRLPPDKGLGVDESR